jgi:mevalonate kinase
LTTPPKATILNKVIDKRFIPIKKFYFNKPANSMTQVSYSAPAKVLFSGEHSVVHGRPAVSSSIDYRLTFTVIEDEIGQNEFEKGVKEANQNVLQYLQQNNIPHTPKNFKYSISSQIPIGQGFGSSAALSVASTAAFLEFYTGQVSPKEVINDLAYNIEVIFHGKPSGSDNSTICFGGLIWFRKEFEYLKTITKLPVEIPQEWQNAFYLVYSGNRAEGTIDLVQAVMKKIEENPVLLKQQLFAMEECTRGVVQAFEQKNADLLRNIFQKNQYLLDQIGVVSQSARDLISNLSQYGVGKVTGAGGVIEGSGYALFFVENNQQVFEHFCNQNGLRFYKVTPESEGVRKENL